MKPKISIVIPTYEAHGRGAELLRELLHTIDYQVNKSFEVVISDHSTTDMIKNEVEKWKDKLNIIYIINDKGRGNASINMNIGISKANGEFIKIMHMDDKFDTPHAIEFLMKKLDVMPDLKWGAYGFNHLSESENTLGGNKIPSMEQIGCPSVSFFKNEGNYFDENLVIINDLDIHTSLYKKYGNPVIIPQICVSIRIHEHQVTKLVTQEQEEKEFRYFEKKHNMPFVYAKHKSEMYENRLSRLANKYGCDKGTMIIHEGNHGPRLHFTTVYHQIFESFREEKLNILEIGIGSGSSLKMWYDYFPNATIHAIDIENFSQHNNDRVFTYVANQKYRGDLLQVMNKIGECDIIIDDGGHMMEQQQVSLGTLFQFLKPAGMYFIEDLHTSYWPHGNFKNLYNQPLDINEDRSNTTVKMIETYLEKKYITSHFLTKQEVSYLNDNISMCNLFNLPETSYGPNKLALFTKKKSNILITGGAGFIGSNLVEKLHSRANDIYVIDNLLEKIHGELPYNSPGYQKIKDKVIFSRADVCDPASYANFDGYPPLEFDAIIHLAAETGTGESMYHYKQYCKNIESAAVLSDLIISGKLKAKKIILASSRAVYGEAILRDRDSEPFPSKEDITSTVPVSFYGITKKIQEQIICKLSKHTNYCILRFQNVYGPGQSLKNPYTGILSIFSNAILNGKSLQIFEDGLMTRDFIYIDDAIDAIMLCIEKNETNNQIFNVGTGARTTVLSIANMLINKLKSKVAIHVTGETRNGDIRHNFADISKINNLLGFSPKVNIEDGIDKFLSWVKTQPITESKYEQSLEEMRKKQLLK